MNLFQGPIAPPSEADRQWIFETSFFIQYIGTNLRNTGDFLCKRDYVQARRQAEALKSKAEYEKTIQPDFKTSVQFQKARPIFNKILDECVHFSELLRVATLLDETGSEELVDKPEQIQNSTERLELLKGMLVYELSLLGWY